MLTATALVATMGEASYFKYGREFAAFVGLAPRQSGTGSKVKLLGISKRCFKHPGVRCKKIFSAWNEVTLEKDYVSIKTTIPSVWRPIRINLAIPACRFPENLVFLKMLL